MSAQATELYSVILFITVTFFAIVSGLVVVVKLYYSKKRRHAEEKKLMSQKFESELLKTHLEVQEQTMQTIATDLHDNIGQLLSLTTLTLNSINLSDVSRSEKKIASSLKLINTSIKELRDLAKLLQGEQLVEFGLGKAIKQELDRLKRVGGYKLKVKNQLLKLNLASPKKDLIILRLLQEIINNVIKHADARQVAIDLLYADELLHLNVVDDGIGFDYEAVKEQKSGIGLYSIHKRIEMINGKIHICSQPNKGTVITIEIPYP